MTSAQRLELRQGQSLTMTPQLAQAIKLLQLSHLELAAYVAAELECNPLLQEADRAGEAPDLADFLRAKQKSAQSGPRFVPGLAPPRREGGPAASSAPASGHAELSPSLEESLARPSTLTDHLEAQLDGSTADPGLRALGRDLIHSLDEAGYLEEDLSEIAARLTVPIERAEAALRLIQGFDPPGIGARSLSECLSLQLRERNRLDPAMEALLARLDLIARRDWKALSRHCGVDREDLDDMLAEIRSLEPKPGHAFAPAPIQTLVPDVVVRPGPGGGIAVELNPETMPRILLDRSYHAKVSKLIREDEDKAFLSDCLHTASWLTRSLDQRARTILAVAAEIARRQEAFFREGVGALRPLTLRAVAEAIGMHESTISRVAANKAIGTARGTYPMKFFFSAALGEDGPSAKAVRHRIGRLIADEAPGQGLSDGAIARILKAEGIGVARRTVAKYREALRIPPLADRRRRHGRKGRDRPL